jgi:hypothetical protein
MCRCLYLVSLISILSLPQVAVDRVVLEHMDTVPPKPPGRLQLQARPRARSQASRARVVLLQRCGSRDIWLAFTRVGFASCSGRQGHCGIHKGPLGARGGALLAQPPQPSSRAVLCRVPCCASAWCVCAACRSRVPCVVPSNPGALQDMQLLGLDLSKGLLLVWDGERAEVRRGAAPVNCWLSN